MSLDAISPDSRSSRPLAITPADPKVADAATTAPQDGAPAKDGASAKAAGDDDLTFWDVLDVINPLQHLPIIGNIYRAITGDTIKEAPRMMGGILFGGVLGGVSALANIIVEDKTGRDIGGNIIADVFGDDAYPSSTMVANAGETGSAATAKSPMPVTSGAIAAAKAGTDAKAEVAEITRQAEIAAKTPTPPKRSMTGREMLDSYAQRKLGSSGLPDGETGNKIARNAVRRAPSPTTHLRQMPIHPEDHRNTTVPSTTIASAASAPTSTSATATNPADKTATVPVRGRGTDRQRLQASASPPQAQGVDTANPNAAFAPALDPATLPDVILRNLAKYEQARRAANPAVASTDLSG